MFYLRMVFCGPFAALGKKHNFVPGFSKVAAEVAELCGVIAVNKQDAHRTGLRRPPSSCSA